MHLGVCVAAAGAGEDLVAFENALHELFLRAFLHTHARARIDACENILAYRCANIDTDTCTYRYNIHICIIRPAYMHTSLR